MQPVRIAEEQEVRDEVQRLEIVLGVGQKFVAQPQRVEALDVGNLGAIGPQPRQQPIRIEIGDEDQRCRALGKFCQGAGIEAGAILADLFEALDIDALDGPAGQIVHRGQIGEIALGVIDGDLARARDLVDQLRGQRSSQGMDRRAIEYIAAGLVVECP